MVLRGAVAKRPVPSGQLGPHVERKVLGLLQMVLMGRGRTPSRAANHRIVGTAGVALLCAGALAITTAQATPSAADPNKEKLKVDARVEQLKELLDDTSQDLSAAYVALEATKGRLPAARIALADAVSKALAADRANSVAAQEFEAAKASEDKAQAQLSATTMQVSASRTRVAQFAAQVYQEQGFGQLDMALSSTDPQQFADRLALVDTVMGVQGETMERLATEQASLTALEDHLSALRADSAEKKEQAEAALARAESARDDAARAKADLDQLAANQAAQARAVADKLVANKARLATMQAEQERLKKVLAQRAEEARRAAAARRAEEARKAAASRRAAGGGKTATSPGGSSGGGDEAPGRSGGYLSAPSSGRISSEFGQRFHPIYQYWKLHAGRDYAAPCGSPIRAAADGTIIMAGDGGGYGNRVVIDHGIVSGDGLATTYNHMQSIRKRSGSISRGDVVGYVGTTGTSTGCHLHFEALQDGDFVDPRRWL
ncbi:murein DD-endopeptidase MepM/ murein hydrolase activator NlpD [Ornithinibacter aureus]|nr:murein DD-endopeptidase MepM/ murein hydrolase activator NlpD [Ornithinibacter aureus]